MSFLIVENVSKVFGGLRALSGVSLSIRRGEIFSVIGPNGAGKTTLFNVLTGACRPDHGCVRLDGRDITGRPAHRIAAGGIGRTFQNIRLFRAMTVLENVLVGEHARTRYSYLDALLRTPRFSRQERAAWHRAADWLSFVGLGELGREIAGNLAYGDQRRLELARALALQPEVLLLDEPGAGMNPREIQGLQQLIRRARDELKKTVVLIEHHMKLVMSISDRLAVLDYGTKICEGTPEAVRENPQVIEAYLGKGAVENKSERRTHAPEP